MSAIDINKNNLKEILNRNYFDILNYFGIDTFRELNKKKKYNNFTITNDIRDYIDNVTAEKVTLITDNSKNKIKSIILKGLENNDSIDIIADNIKNVYGIFSTSRARTIAFTEVASISNYAMYIAAKQSDRTKKKWRFNNDEKTRKTHRAVGKTGFIGIDELFKVGNSMLLYPADPTGEAKEIIRCRCWLEFE